MKLADPCWDDTFLMRSIKDVDCQVSLMQDGEHECQENKAKWYSWTVSVLNAVCEAEERGVIHMAEKVAGARNVLPESVVFGSVRDGIASSPEWDRRMTKEEFEKEFLKISNHEVDMYKVKPCRVGIRSSEVI